MNGIDRIICVVRDVKEGVEQEVVVWVPGSVLVDIYVFFWALVTVRGVVVWF